MCIAPNSTTAYRRCLGSETHACCTRNQVEATIVVFDDGGVDDGDAVDVNDDYSNDAENQNMTKNILAYQLRHSPCSRKIHPRYDTGASWSHLEAASSEEMAEEATCTDAGVGTGVAAASAIGFVRSVDVGTATSVAGSVGDVAGVAGVGGSEDDAGWTTDE